MINLIENSTPVNADHVTGTGLIRLYYSLLIKSPGVKSIISKASGSEADLLVEPGGHDDACLVEFVLSWFL
ncbi:hypothetical protein NC653_005902 [Populus alba x Populus x berolinensis]|uniref:Uncharacterized protein n=1 Tax=Populus alba x Populus x berolinensis TaxID=444605 RepID=A0AAD6WDN1_9ROSI|nr:hypothetical protein NC653_005902 [Populus alba x Populus x berolinensis]